MYRKVKKLSVIKRLLAVRKILGFVWQVVCLEHDSVLGGALAGQRHPGGEEPAPVAGAGRQDPPARELGAGAEAGGGL